MRRLGLSARRLDGGLTMRQPNDTKTPDLVEMDLAGEVPPKVNRAALRAAKFRALHGVKAMTVNLPVALLAELEAWFAAGKNKGATKSDVIARLIRTKLLRKR